MRTKIQLLDLVDKTSAAAGLHIATKGDGTFILESPPLSGASGTVVLYDGAILKGSADTLRFVGAGVSVALSGTFAHIEIPGGGGGGGGGIGIFGLDDGIPLGTGTSLDFGVSLAGSRSGTVLQVDVDVPTTGTVVIYDETTLLGSVENLVVEGDTVYASQTGAFGFVSFSGSIGPQGPEGATGSQGEQGAEGATGAQGIQGIEGATGSQGIQGVEGATGSIGPQGPEGATGSQGIQGIEGATGSQGPQGPEGATGSQGIQGAEGATGSVGPQGPEGATGSQGEQGAEGATGATGPAGGGGGAGGIGVFGLDDGVPLGTGTSLDFGVSIVGSLSGTVLQADVDLPTTGTVVLYDETTLLGPVEKLVVEGDPAYASQTGVFGFLSFSGSIGPQGPQGAEGATGSQGIQGIEGATGSQGIQGVQGPSGSQGIQGIEGATGSQGIQGVEGATGATGPAGGGGGGGLGVFGLDDGVPLGTGTTIDWGANLDASLSGSVFLIEGQAGGGDSSTGTFDVGTVIFDETLTGTQADFSVTGIAIDYEYIEIHVTARKSTTSSTDLVLTLNGDTTNANYRRTAHQAEVGSHTVTEGDSRVIGAVVGSDGPTNTVGAVKATIFDPGNTTYHKNVSAVSIHSNPVTDLYVGHVGTIWEDTSAIREIALNPGAGSFLAGSRCKIVGFRNEVFVTSVEGGGGAGGGDFVKITDVILTSDGLFDFSVPTGTYTHLLLHTNLRSNDGGVTSEGVAITFNGDTGSNYDSTIWFVNADAGVAGSSSDGVGITHIRSNATGDNAPSNSYAPFTLNILDIGNTDIPTSVHGDGYYQDADSRGSMWRFIVGGKWNGTAAINSVRIAPKVATGWLDKSRATLYGLK